MKNEDSLYKFLTYSAMLEKTRKENINQTRKSDEIAFGLDTFEEYYKKTLQIDAKKDPRPINEEEYLKGSKVQQDRIKEGFMTQAEREVNYVQEYELYKENKSKIKILII